MAENRRVGSRFGRDVDVIDDIPSAAEPLIAAYRVTKQLDTAQRFKKTNRITAGVVGQSKK